MDAALDALGGMVEMIDLFAVVLHTKPTYPGVGMAEDVAHKLQREIDRIEREERQAPRSAGD